jgi:HEAT repeat protein
LHASSAAEARRRGRAALAGHTADEETARSLLHDEAPRVRAAAVGALVRMGRFTAELSEQVVADPSPVVRRSLCELSSSIGSSISARYGRLLHDEDPSVVEAACFAAGETGDTSELGALVEIAGTHPDPLCRESAVAALGALGHPAGLPAILGATRDRPAVRRRAVIALAPFDGPEVEDALERAANDRDWQVRQAAEDQRR